jgi:hypothetical protein
MLNKDQLIFDPTEVADSDSVGAFVRSSDGTLITHTQNGAKEALDVNIAEFTSAGVKIVDSDGDELEVNADGSINVVTTINDPVKFRLDGAVVEVVEDTVTPANNQPLPVKLTSLTGDINITAGDLNVQLTHTGGTPDSVQIGDGTEIASITANTHLEVVDRSDDGLATSAVSVDNTVGGTQLVSSALTERKYIEIQNLENRTVFLGASGVTSSTGIRIPPRASWSGKVGPNISLYGITNSGTADVRILELA